MEQSHNDRGLIIELRHQSILDTEKLLRYANGVDQKTLFKCERSFDLSRSCEPGCTVLEEIDEVIEFSLSLNDLRLQICVKFINVIFCYHDHRHDCANYSSLSSNSAAGRGRSCGNTLYVSLTVCKIILTFRTSDRLIRNRHTTIWTLFHMNLL